jgi:Domain of unknown function (DUF4340)
MKLRTLALTVAVLAALSVVAFLANRPPSAPAADPRVGKPLLDADTAARAASLTVSDKGKTIEVRKGADGAWRVPSYFNLPADFEKVSRLVQDLHEAKVDRFVTSNPERLAHMDFADTAITLGDATGKPLWSATFGRESESGNGRFIRFGTEAASFFSTLHVWFDTDAKSWADTRLVTLKADEVSSVDVGFDGGTRVAATRPKKDAPWQGAAPAGKRLVPEKVASVLTTMTSLRFSDTTPPDDPGAAEAAKHARSIRLTTFDGKTLTITLGRKPEEKRRKAPAPSPTPTPSPADKAEAKPAAEEYETIPAGPVYCWVESSDAKAVANESMKLRSFQVDDFVYTGLPQSPDDLREPTKAK